MPALLLQNRSFETIGAVTNVHDFIYKEHFNSPNEISFTIYKDNGETIHPLWDSLINFKIIYIPEFGERFEIAISTASAQTTIKSVTGTSLCESELSQIRLYDIEINTEHDIANISYDPQFPTVFYRNPQELHNYDWTDSKYRDYSDEKKKEVLKRSSLLHRILEKAEHYSIGTVDKSLKNLQREFSISDTDIYSELTGELAEEFHCIFLFDSLTRTISAHDLYHTCKSCGYRGDFTHKCPECGSTEFEGQYGMDTSVFISNENLAEEISLDSNKDSLKNCFYVEGGDEIITAAVKAMNPNGTNYIYDFNHDTETDMPKALSAVIKSYDELYKHYVTTKSFPLNSAAVNNYNTVVREVNALFSDDPSICFAQLQQTLTGYASVIEAIYEATDLYGFLKDSMMPTIRIDGLGLEDSLQNILTGFREGFSTLNADGSTTKSFPNQIAIRNHTTAIQSSVENAIQKSAKLYYSTAYYNLEITTLNYTQATSSSYGTWKGTFTLESLAEKDPQTGENLQKQSPQVTLTIVDHLELYLEQSIYKKMTKDKSKYSEVTSLKMDFNTFKEKITHYSLSELARMKESFQACLDIIISAEFPESAKALSQRYYDFYSKRFQYIDLTEQPKREAQIKRVQALYSFDSSANKTSGILSDVKNETNRILDFKKYLLSNPLKYEAYQGEDLWKTFCAYRREDKYTNSNYISDGMNNAEIIAHAKKLLDTAKKELYTASNPQYTLSANMDNLLALEAFAPLTDAFSCGNWIRLEIDGDIYRLRLLSYQIAFDDIASIDVEFSTVEKLWSGNSDLKSILTSAKSIAGSYSYTTQQVKQSLSASNYVNSWIEEGLAATAAKIINDHDTQAITIDQNGILCREYDDIQDAYSPFQARFINNGLYVTADNWKTVKAALGKFIYSQGGTEKTAYGILAESLVGKFIIGEQLFIQNSAGNLIFDSGGFKISNSKNTITMNPNDEEKLFRISNAGHQDVFYTNAKGDIILEGAIYSRPGSTIGNLSVGENKLTYGSFGIDTSITEPQNTALWLGKDTPSSAPFRVTYGGKLYAEDADIRGKILSTSGKIGGFTIGNSYLANNTTALGTTANSVYVGTNGISCGTSFKVTSAGELSCSNINIQSSSGNNTVIINNNGLFTNTIQANNTNRIVIHGWAGGWLGMCDLFEFSGGSPDGKEHLAYISTACNAIDFLAEVIMGASLIVNGNIKENGTYLSEKYQAKGSYLPTGGGTITGDTYFKARMHTHSLVPEEDATYPLGSPEFKYSTVYSKNFVENGTSLSKKYVTQETYEKKIVSLENSIKELQNQVAQLTRIANDLSS